MGSRRCADPFVYTEHTFLCAWAVSSWMGLAVAGAGPGELSPLPQQGRVNNNPSLAPYGSDDLFLSA